MGLCWSVASRSFLAQVEILDGRGSVAADIVFVDHIRVRVRICHGQVLSAGTNLRKERISTTLDGRPR
jgi:hypothetical protein